MTWFDLSLSYGAKRRRRRLEAGRRSLLGGKDAGSRYYFVTVGRVTLALEVMR